MRLLEYITISKPSTITDGYIKLLHKVIEWIFKLLNLINTNYESIGIPLIKTKIFEDVLNYSNAKYNNSVEEKFE
jgi:hypothetical protein